MHANTHIQKLAIDIEYMPWSGPEHAAEHESNALALALTRVRLSLWCRLVVTFACCTTVASSSCRCVFLPPLVIITNY